MAAAVVLLIGLLALIAVRVILWVAGALFGALSSSAKRTVDEGYTYGRSKTSGGSGTAVAAVIGGSIGGLAGSSIGIAAFGTAFAGTIPGVVLGILLGILLLRR